MMKKPRSYRVRPIDMKKGMFVIVSEWYGESNSHTLLGINKPVGLPLRIEAVALPLIAVSYMPTPGIRGVMDTRRSEFMRVPASYVKALLPDYGKKPVTKELIV